MKARREAARSIAFASCLAIGCSHPSGTARGGDAQGSRASFDGARAPSGDLAAPPAGEPASGVAPSAPLPATTADRARFAAASADVVVGEPRRARLARLEDEPLFRSLGGALREHFGAGARGPFDVQRIDVPGSRTAALIARADGADPFVIVVERDLLLWSKPHPTWGMVSPVRSLTIAARPDGGIVLFGWVEPLHTVAARMWADDGNAFGDFEVFAPDACEALSAARAPSGEGWIVACAAAGGTRAQHLREEGTSAWGAGLAVGSGSASGAVGLAFDSPSSLMMIERAAAIGGDRLLAFRYALADGARLWETPIDLGVVTAPRSSSARAATMTGGDGVVRIAPVRGVASLRDRGMTISSEGRVAR